MTPKEMRELAARIIASDHFEFDCTPEELAQVLEQWAAAMERDEQKANDVDAVLRLLRRDPEIYRTECGWLNVPKIAASVKPPDEYPILPLPPASDSMAQKDGAVMGDGGKAE